MLYINSKDEPEFVNENDESLESHNSIYDLSESLDYTGLNYIRVFPEDKDMGIEVQVDTDIKGGILKVLPSTLTHVTRLPDEEDGSIIVSKDNGELKNKVSFTRSPEEYKKIFREIQTSSLDSVYIRISTRQKELDKKVPEDSEALRKKKEYYEKLLAIQNAIQKEKHHYVIQDKIEEVINHRQM